ncbi:hypothetical protein D3C76_553730 [compost metagenome]
MTDRIMLEGIHTQGDDQELRLVGLDAFESICQGHAEGVPKRATRQWIIGIEALTVTDPFLISKA